MRINAFAASSAGKTLEPFQYECSDPQEHEVQIRISHCGICHSDIHLIDNDWKISKYPLVPGHEIVGTVTSVGRSVRHLQQGQRVGVGWQRSSCLECEWCIRGQENLCEKNEPVTVTHYGGFASHICVDSRFAFPVPDKLSSENAAPLLCGGITVFTPLRLYNVTPLMKVGVIGVGGLGHLALQFAAAFGCEVTAFSSSAGKEKETRELGASNFVLSSDQKLMQDCARSQDMLLVTATVDLDWMSFINTLRPNGKICFLGAIPSPISVPAFTLLGSNLSLCGSNIGGRPMISDMLQFAARHDIKARVEVVSMGSVNEAIERVRNNKARYRMVLAN